MIDMSKFVSKEILTQLFHCKPMEGLTFNLRMLGKLWPQYTLVEVQSLELL